MNVLLITEICQSIQCCSHAVFSAFLFAAFAANQVQKTSFFFMFLLFLMFKNAKFYKYKCMKNLLDNAVFRRKKFVKNDRL